MDAETWLKLKQEEVIGDQSKGTESSKASSSGGSSLNEQRKGRERGEGQPREEQQEKQREQQQEGLYNPLLKAVREGARVSNELPDLSTDQSTMEQAPGHQSSSSSSSSSREEEREGGGEGGGEGEKEGKKEGIEGEYMRRADAYANEVANVLHSVTESVGSEIDWETLLNAVELKSDNSATGSNDNSNTNTSDERAFAPISAFNERLYERVGALLDGTHGTDHNSTSNSNSNSGEGESERENEIGDERGKSKIDQDEEDAAAAAAASFLSQREARESEMHHLQPQVSNSLRDNSNGNGSGNGSGNRYENKSESNNPTVEEASLDVSRDTEKEKKDEKGKEKNSPLRGTGRKPQDYFPEGYRVDNSRRPFVPTQLLEKPNAIVQLPSTLDELASSNTNPYLPEMRNALQHLPDWLCDGDELDVQPPENSHTVVVETTSQLSEMCEHIALQKAVAIMTETHTKHSFQGLTCLLMISSPTMDFVIDTLALRSQIQRLNVYFTNPQILKLMHNGKTDIDNLQRDFGCYVVQLFDTSCAASQLNFDSTSFGYCVRKLCGNVQLNKKMELRDVMERPIPNDLVSYTRLKTRYLMQMYDSLTKKIWSHTPVDTGAASPLASEKSPIKGLIIPIMQSSLEISSRVYQKPQFSRSQSREEAASLVQKFGLGSSGLDMEIVEDLLDWRDQVARNQDESLDEILPSIALLRIARNMPRDERELEDSCKQISDTRFVQAFGGQILDVINRRRSLSLNQNQANPGHAHAHAFGHAYGHDDQRDFQEQERGKEKETEKGTGNLESFNDSYPNSPDSHFQLHPQQQQYQQPGERRQERERVGHHRRSSTGEVSGGSGYSGSTSNASSIESEHVSSELRASAAAFNPTGSPVRTKTTIAPGSPPTAGPSSPNSYSGREQRLHSQSHSRSPQSRTAFYSPRQQQPQPQPQQQQQQQYDSVTSPPGLEPNVEVKRWLTGLPPMALDDQYLGSASSEMMMPSHPQMPALGHPGYSVNDSQQQSPPFAFQHGQDMSSQQQLPSVTSQQAVDPSLPHTHSHAYHMGGSMTSDTQQSQYAPFSMQTQPQLQPQPQSQPQSQPQYRSDHTVAPTSSTSKNYMMHTTNTVDRSSAARERSRDPRDSPSPVMNSDELFKEAGWLDVDRIQRNFGDEARSGNYQQGSSSQRNETALHPKTSPFKTRSSIDFSPPSSSGGKQKNTKSMSERVQMNLDNASGISWKIPFREDSMHGAGSSRNNYTDGKHGEGKSIEGSELSTSTSQQYNHEHPIPESIREIHEISNQNRLRNKEKKKNQTTAIANNAQYHQTDLSLSSILENQEGSKAVIPNAVPSGPKASNEASPASPASASASASASTASTKKKKSSNSSDSDTTADQRGASPVSFMKEIGWVSPENMVKVAAMKARESSTEGGHHHQHHHHHPHAHHHGHHQHHSSPRGSHSGGGNASGRSRKGSSGSGSGDRDSTRPFSYTRSLAEAAGVNAHATTHASSPGGSNEKKRGGANSNTSGRGRGGSPSRSGSGRGGGSGGGANRSSTSSSSSSPSSSRPAPSRSYTYKQKR